MSAPLLQVSGLALRFGGVAALAGAGLAVPEGEICGVIGPNGAGKTTLFNCISGLSKPDAGSIVFDGRRIDGLPPHRVARLGIARTFQNLGLYAERSVLENTLLGGHLAHRGGLAAAVLHLPRVAVDERRLRERALELLAEVGLADQAQVPAGSLPYGTMKRIELARALLASPRLLLLDEPAGGLTQQEVATFAELVHGLRRRHALTVLLVEHHMALVAALCDHVVVLHAGATLADGTPEQVRNDRRVIEAYLGVAA